MVFTTILRTKKTFLPRNLNIEAMTAIIFSGMLGATIIYNADRSQVNVNKTIGYIIDYVVSMEK